MKEDMTLFARWIELDDNAITVGQRAYALFGEGEKDTGSVEVLATTSSEFAANPDQLRFCLTEHML
jgi:hypothetical protein